MGPKKQKASSSQPDDLFSDPEVLTICRGKGKEKSCKGTYTSVLQHLAKGKTNCLRYYTPSEHTLMKNESLKRRKQKYNKDNAELIAKRQAVYDATHRTEKRQSQATYDAAHRNEKRHSQAIYDAKNRKEKALYYQVKREKILEKLRKERQISRDNLTSKERLCNFKLEIIDGPNYVCCSCKRCLFKALNVLSHFPAKLTIRIIFDKGLFQPPMKIFVDKLFKSPFSSVP